MQIGAADGGPATALCGGGPRAEVVFKGSRVLECVWSSAGPKAWKTCVAGEIQTASVLDETISLREGCSASFLRGAALGNPCRAGTAPLPGAGRSRPPRPIAGTNLSVPQLRARAEVDSY